jgi:hypothetical protein
LIWAGLFYAGKSGIVPSWLASLPVLPSLFYIALNFFALCVMKEHWNRFKSFGHPETSERAFESEFGDERQVTALGNLYVTPNWIYHDEKSSLFLLPCKAVVWAYEKNENDSRYLVLRFSDGEYVSVLLDAEKMQTALDAIAESNPGAVIGYGKKLEEAAGKHKAVFEAALSESPGVVHNTDSPFRFPFFETVVYVKIRGVKKKCLLTLTRDKRLALTRNGETLFNREVSELKKFRRRGIGRFSVDFGERAADYVIKTYDFKLWKNVIALAQRGKIPGGFYAAKSYNDIDDPEFAKAQNKFYLRFPLAFLGLLFWLIIFPKSHIDGIVWEDGAAMGVLTYFILPLVLFPGGVYLVIWFKGFTNCRLFPKREDGE